MYASAVQAEYILTSIVTIEIDHTRHMWQIGRFPGPNVTTFKALYFGRLTFSTQIKSMDSRNMKHVA